MDGTRLILCPKFLASIVLTAFVSFVLYIAPNVWLNEKIKRRQTEIFHALPDVLDLLGTKKSCIASHVCFADSFLARLKGLPGKKSLDGGHALVISPCVSIHTVGMSLYSRNSPHGQKLKKGNKRKARDKTASLPGGLPCFSLHWMSYASFAGIPGGTSIAGDKKDAGVEAIKTGNSETAGFGHAALEAVPETGIEIKSPSDGAVIDCIESADITVAGAVKGKVDKVRVYVNGVSYEARAARRLISSSASFCRMAYSGMTTAGFPGSSNPRGRR